jgi:hypothetical protein
VWVAASADEVPAAPAEAPPQAGFGAVAAQEGLAAPAASPPALPVDVAAALPPGNAVNPAGAGAAPVASAAPEADHISDTTVIAAAPAAAPRPDAPQLVEPQSAAPQSAAPLALAAQAAETGGAPAALPAAAAPPADSHGLGCLAIGALASAGVLIYSNTLAVAITGGPNPNLVLPLMVAGYAVGCGIGASVSPGLHWLTGHIS